MRGGNVIIIVAVSVLILINTGGADGVETGVGSLAADLLTSLASLFVSLGSMNPDDPNPPEFEEGQDSQEQPAGDRVTYHLFTRSNPEKPIQIYINSLNNSAYDPNKGTKFIVHGFQSKFFYDEFIKIKDAFLRAGDYNVIGVDWSGPASEMMYPGVCLQNVGPTAEHLASLYDSLEDQGASFATMHCVGHSLGAHVCGLSGKVRRGALGRVSGLDPAGPMYELARSDKRLSKKDARFVDVIHSCGGLLGLRESVGHADFYPNGGGFAQPGCGPDITGVCSHERAHNLFLESIKSSDFVARECGSWTEYQNGSCEDNGIAVMGFYTSTRARGTFYLATASEPPFALGE